MTTILILVMLMWVGFFGLCWWLGKKATQNPTEAAQLGVRIGKWFMK
jgi:flagellar basal body-associated protein FliL